MHIVSKNRTSGKTDYTTLCSHCASPLNIRHGTYQRAHPQKDELVSIQRYLCKSPDCPRKTFSILPFPFLRVMRHFHPALFWLHVHFHEKGLNQAETARQLGVSRGICKRLALFCRCFMPWFERERHIGEWGPDPEATPARSWADYNRDFSHTFYPKRWAVS